jgi:hypothetical protein
MISKKEKNTRHPSEQKTKTNQNTTSTMMRIRRGVVGRHLVHRRPGSAANNFI